MPQQSRANRILQLYIEAEGCINPVNAFFASLERDRQPWPEGDKDRMDKGGKGK